MARPTTASPSLGEQVRALSSVGATLLYGVESAKRQHILRAMKHRTIERLAIAFLFVAICIVFAEHVSRPPGAIPENAPPTAFSAARAMKHVVAIAQRPHPIGSAEHDRVRDYLVAQL